MNENTETMETAENGTAENGAASTFRSTRQLRSDIEKGIGEVRGAKEAWADALRRQERERNEQNGMATYGQMKELVGRQELAELQNRQRVQDAIASALAIAQQNGGSLPGVVTDYLNRQFGFDGKNLGIMGGGIDPETGEFGFEFGERDNAGNIAHRKQTIPLAVQLGLMEGYPGLFSEDAIKAHRQKMLEKSGLSSGEIEAYSNVARLSRDRLAKRMEELTPRDARSGWSPERMQLERDRLTQRSKEEEGRNARAGTKNDTANARLAASVAKNMPDIRRGLKLNDEQATQFQASLTKILAEALGGGEEAGEADGDANHKESIKPRYNTSRTVRDIRSAPQDGDELPLKGGGRARYNGKTKKWEKAL